MSNNSTTPPCSAAIQDTSIGFTVFLIFILIVTFIGNLLVILAVIFFRRLRSITNYFIVSLAVSDLLIALLSLPFRIDQTLNNGYWCLPLEVCQLWFVVDATCSFASMWNLVIISIDRFIVITRPYKYYSVMTSKVGYGLISSVWTFSIFLALMMLINWSGLDPNFNTTVECAKNDPIYYTVAVSLAFFLPLLIIIVMYGKVFQVAFNQMKSLASLQVDDGNRTRNGARKKSINLIREMKAARTLAVVIGCFVFCWLPLNVILLIIFWDMSLLDINKLGVDALTAISWTFTYVLPVLNSTMNPIIYALMNREFRSAFKNLGRRMTGRRLGAVGGGDKILETTTTRSCSILNDHTIDPYGARFSDQDSDSSAHQLPIMHSSLNEQRHEQLSTGNNNFKTSHDTTLEEEQKTKIQEDTAVSAQNGHLSTSALCDNDVTQCGTDVTQSDNDDVTKYSNDVTPLDNDVTQYDSEVIENVNALSSSTTELCPSKGSSPTLSIKNESGQAGTTHQYSSLPPIESSSTLEVDRKVAISPKSSAKRLNVSPSPDCSRKNIDDDSISENAATDNTLL